MLQLRAFATSERVVVASRRLVGAAGVRHLTIGRTTIDGSAVLTGDVEPDVSDDVLAILRELGFHADDVTLWRATSIQPLAPDHRVDSGQDAAVWAEVASRAMSHARLAGTVPAVHGDRRCRGLRRRGDRLVDPDRRGDGVESRPPADHRIGRGDRRAALETDQARRRHTRHRDSPSPPCRPRRRRCSCG